MRFNAAPPRGAIRVGHRRERKMQAGALVAADQGPVDERGSVTREDGEIKPSGTIPGPYSGVICGVFKDYHAAEHIAA